jgi:DNA-binding transcriptional LysR family regulator
MKYYNGARTHLYPWRKMRRSRAPSIAPGTFFVVQSWADCITNMPGFNLRQAQRVVEGYSGVLTRQVKAGELEFAIVPALSETVGLKSRLLTTTPELLVMKKSPSARTSRHVRLSELDPLKLIVPGRGNAKRILLDAYFASNGVRVERLMELDAMLGTLGFLSDRLGSNSPSGDDIGSPGPQEL